MTEVKVSITQKPTDEKPVDLTVRRLKTRDVFTVLSLITDSVGSPEEVNKLFQGLTSKDHMAIGISAVYGLLRGLLHTHQDELIEWFASLVNVSVSEFDDLPPTAVIQIMAALKEHGDMQDFFEKLSRAFSQLEAEPISDQKPPESTLPDPSTKSNDDTGGMTS